VVSVEEGKLKVGDKKQNCGEKINVDIHAGVPQGHVPYTFVFL